MKFTVLHSIPDCAEGGQLAKSRERDGGRGENISVADIMVNSDRVRRWLGATMCRAAGLGRFTAPLATSRRWFCLPYTSVDGAGVEPVAGYGASPAPFPQFLPRWARAEALDRPTGTTVVALDARRRVPRRPDVVQLDAGEIAGNDRVPLGGRVRSRPRPCSWSTCPARPTTESPQLVDVSGLDRGPAAGRRAPVVTLKNPAQGPRRA